MKRNKTNKGLKKQQVDSTKVSTNKLRPVFSLSKMQRGTGYSIECCERDDCAAFSSKLFELSQLDWQTIQNSGRHAAGSETIKKSNLKHSVAALIPEDGTPLSIRFNGKKPMLGYRKDQIFYVIALDKDFSVYPHGGS